MKIMEKVTAAVVNATSDTLFKVEKKSPEILIGTGIAFGVISAVMACKATLKATDVVEEVKTNIDEIHKAEEIAKENEEVKYDDKDKAKDLIIACSNGAIKIAGLYWKPVLLGVLSIGVILKGHNILQKRHLALLAAYSSLEKSYDSLYSRLVTDLGKDNADRFRDGISTKSVEVVEEDPETGKSKKKKIKDDFIDDLDALGPDTYLFGPYSDLCQSWYAGDMILNGSYMKGQESNANFKISEKPSHILTLSEVFTEMNAREIPKEAYSRGWRRPKDWFKRTAKQYISWDIKEVWHDYGTGEGPRKCLLVNFNCDGNVLYDVPEKDELQ